MPITAGEGETQESRVQRATIWKSWAVQLKPLQLKTVTPRVLELHVMRLQEGEKGCQNYQSRFTDHRLAVEYQEFFMSAPKFNIKGKW